MRIRCPKKFYQCKELRVRGWGEGERKREHCSKISVNSWKMAGKKNHLCKDNAHWALGYLASCDSLWKYSPVSFN